MNKIILLGRLTKDPEVKYTNNDKVVCLFTLAVDRPYTNQQGKREADFINVVLWGKQAETFGNYFTKGQRALVEGRLQIRSYDGKDGQKHYVTEVIASGFEFIEKANKQGEAPAAVPPPQGSFENFGQAVPFDEEIPF